MINDLIRKNRSYRRFHEEKEISLSVLENLVDLTRYCASGRNLQPLKYFLSSDPKLNKLIYPSLVWAGYLPHWHGPEAGEQPAAYIVICEDAMISSEASFDVGIAAQTISLGAMGLGIGSCIILSFNKLDLTYLFHLEEYMKPVMVIALGYPKEKVVIEQLEDGDSVKYWRDEDEVLHVPKRKLEDIIIPRYPF